MEFEESDVLTGLKKNIIAIHLGRDNDERGNDKANTYLESIKKAAKKKKGRTAETMQVLLPTSSQSPILGDKQLDYIAAVSKRNDLIGGENTQIILLFNHNPSHGIILGTKYTIQNLGDIFNGLAEREVKPDINLIACAFGRRLWDNNRREASSTTFGKFLNSIKNPRIGQKISGYRLGVFVDADGRRTFDYGTGDKEHKEKLIPDDQRRYKTMAIFDESGEWLEPSRREFSSKTSSEKNSFVMTESAGRSRDRIARNAVGSRNFQHSAKDFFDKRNFAGDMKGKMIGHDANGSMGFLQLAPKTKNNTFQFIWINPGEYGLESIKKGDYVNFNTKMLESGGSKTCQVKAEKIDLNLEDGLSLEVSNMLSKQIEQYKRVQDIPDLETFPDSYAVIKKTDSEVYVCSGNGRISKTSASLVSQNNRSSFSR